MGRRFWVGHAVVPAIVFALAFGWIVAADADFRLAHWLFYQPTRHSWEATGTWWAELMHEGGRGLVETVATSALLVFIGGRFFRSVLPLRSAAAFVAVAIALSTGVVAILKAISNVDCPWDLTEFGGTHAFVSLFGHRAAGLPRVECFPGAHSAAGFSLVCFYFVLRDRALRAAKMALAAAIVTGSLFAYVQQARGAHFLSHDLASAAFVWYLQLALYVRYPVLRADSAPTWTTAWWKGETPRTSRTRTT